MKRFIGLIAISILASCNTPLENGLDHFSNKEFEDAIRKFEMIDPSDESYDSAQKMIELANVQINLIKRETEKRDSLSKYEQLMSEKSDYINKLLLEIDNIRKFNCSESSVIDNIKSDISTINNWINIITEARTHPAKEVRLVRNEMIRELRKMQISEFPILRKNIVKYLDKQLWEDNIDVESKGSASRTVCFIGGRFASNAAKKEYYESLQSTFYALRYGRIEFKWHELDDEYTYYEMYAQGDSKITTIIL